MFAQQVLGRRMAQTRAGGPGKGAEGRIQGWLRNGDRKGPWEEAWTLPLQPRRPSGWFSCSRRLAGICDFGHWGGFFGYLLPAELSAGIRRGMCLPLQGSHSGQGGTISKIKQALC